MILRNAKVAKYCDNTMAEKEEVDIDSQNDMTKYSGSSQICDKEMVVDNTNKEVLNMMPVMFSHLEEKLAENQKQLIESQENPKISMKNSLKESVDKIEKAMKCLEDRMNIKVIQQREELNVEIQEVEDRMIQRTMEETDWVKEYVDNSMIQRIEIVKSGMSEITRQFDRRFKEIDEVEARNSERYKTLEEKI